MKTPNPAPITHTTATRKRGRTWLHLHTTPAAPPVLALDAATLAAPLTLPCLVHWQDQPVGERGRVARIITRIQPQENPQP